MSSWGKHASALVALAGALFFLSAFSHGEAVPARRSLTEFPDVIGEWQGRETSYLGETELDILKLSDYVFRRYEHPSGASLWLYVGYWETQTRGAQIHSPKHCLPGGGWEPLDAERVRLPVEEAKKIEVNRFVLQREAAQMVALYWFESQGYATASELEAKIQLVRNSIWNHRSDGALVRVIAPVERSTGEAWQSMTDFVKEMYPRLREYLPDEGAPGEVVG